MLSTRPGGDLVGPELHGDAWRNGVLVSEGTWLQLMCCASYRPWHPNFGGRGSGKDRVSVEKMSCLTEMSPVGNRIRLENGEVVFKSGNAEICCRNK